MNQWVIVRKKIANANFAKNITARTQPFLVEILLDLAEFAFAVFFLTTTH